MSQAFNGAVICTKERIARAIKNYEARLLQAQARIEKMTTLAKSTKERFCLVFKPSVWTLYNNLGSPTVQMRDKLNADVSDEDLKIYCYRSSIYDLKCIVEYLPYPVSECYINPYQAGFVTKWENYK